MMARAGSGLWQGRIQEAITCYQPVGLCPNQKAHSIVVTLFIPYQFWMLMEDLKDLEGACIACIALASGHGLDFSLVTRSLSLRHEITSLWVSPGSLRGRHKARHCVSPETSRDSAHVSDSAQGKPTRKTDQNWQIESNRYIVNRCKWQRLPLSNSHCQTLACPSGLIHVTMPDTCHNILC